MNDTNKLAELEQALRLAVDARNAALDVVQSPELSTEQWTKAADAFKAAHAAMVVAERKRDNFAGFLRDTQRV